MEINISKVGAVNVVEISGRLDTSNYNTANEFFDELISKKEKLIAINLSNLNYVSSSGLRVFLSVLKKAKAIGGNIAIFGLQEKIAEVFEISGFNTLFIITDNQNEAINKLN